MTNSDAHTGDIGSIHNYQLTPGVKVMDCAYLCGGKFIVSSRTNNPPHHIECGHKASIQCIQQMRAKSGLYWDRYVAGMRKAAARYAQGMAVYISTLH